MNLSRQILIALLILSFSPLFAGSTWSPTFKPVEATRWGTIFREWANDTFHTLSVRPGYKEKIKFSPGYFADEAPPEEPMDLVPVLEMKNPFFPLKFGEKPTLEDQRITFLVEGGEALATWFADKGEIHNQWGHIQPLRLENLAPGKLRITLPLSHLDNFGNILRFLPKNTSPGHGRGFLLVISQGIDADSNKKLRLFLKLLGLSPHLSYWDVDQLGDPPDPLFNHPGTILFFANQPSSPALQDRLRNFAFHRGTLLICQDHPLSDGSPPFLGFGQPLFLDFPLSIENQGGGPPFFADRGLFFKVPPHSNPLRLTEDSLPPGWGYPHWFVPIKTIRTNGRQRWGFLGLSPLELRPTGAGLNLFRKLLWFGLLPSRTMDFLRRPPIHHPVSIRFQRFLRLLESAPHAEPG